jgi:hypothetical protein
MAKGFQDDVKSMLTHYFPVGWRSALPRKDFSGKLKSSRKRTTK